MKIEKIQQIQLNSDATEIIVENLKRGFEISHNVLNKIKNGMVKIWSPLPFGTPVPISSHLFDSNRFTEKEEAKDFLVPIISNLLTKTPLNNWILEDNTSKPEYLSKRTHLDNIAKAFTFNDKVYHLFLKENISKENIHKALTWAGGAYPFVGVFSEIDIEVVQRMKMNKVVSNDFKKIAENTSLIIISAYDEEGFVVLELS